MLRNSSCIRVNSEAITSLWCLCWGSEGIFSIPKKMREPMKENTLISTISFLPFSLIFLPAPFVLSVTTTNPIFFLWQGCRGNCLMWDMWKGALRELPRLTDFGRKSCLLKLKVWSWILLAAPVLFSSLALGNPSKWSLEQSIWKQIRPESTLLRSQLSSRVFQSVCCPCDVALVRIYISKVQ